MKPGGAMILPASSAIFRTDHSCKARRERPPALGSDPAHLLWRTRPESRPMTRRNSRFAQLNKAKTSSCEIQGSWHGRCFVMVEPDAHACGRL
jgi:hypothetical protein